MEFGKESETEVQLLKHITNEFGNLSSVVKLVPVTGRTHQLRLHMLHSGHAILGDTMYATGKDLQRSDRLLLHAYSLELNHPVTKQRMRFTTDCPFLEESVEELMAATTTTVSSQPKEKSDDTNDADKGNESSSHAEL